MSDAEFVAAYTELRRLVLLPLTVAPQQLVPQDTHRLSLLIYTDTLSAIFTPVFDTAIDFPKMFGMALFPDSTGLGAILKLNLGDDGPLTQAAWFVAFPTGPGGYAVAYTVIDSCTAAPTGVI